MVIERLPDRSTRVHEQVARPRYSSSRAARGRASWCRRSARSPRRTGRARPRARRARPAGRRRACRRAGRARASSAVAHSRVEPVEDARRAPPPAGGERRADRAAAAARPPCGSGPGNPGTAPPPGASPTRGSATIARITSATTALELDRRATLRVACGRGRGSLAIEILPARVRGDRAAAAAAAHGESRLLELGEQQLLQVAPRARCGSGTSLGLPLRAEVSTAPIRTATGRRDIAGPSARNVPRGEIADRLGLAPLHAEQVGGARHVDVEEGAAHQEVGGLGGDVLGELGEPLRRDHAGEPALAPAAHQVGHRARATRGGPRRSPRRRSAGANICASSTTTSAGYQCSRGASNSAVEERGGAAHLPFDLEPLEARAPPTRDARGSARRSARSRARE